MTGRIFLRVVVVAHRRAVGAALHVARRSIKRFPYRDRGHEPGAQVRHRRAPNDVVGVKELTFQPLVHLVDEGRVRRWKGRGGSYLWVDEERTASKPSASSEDQKFGVESDFQSLVFEVLKTTWLADQSYNQSVSEVVDTSSSGATDTGGTWSRPDIAVLGVEDTKYFGRCIDVLTFELKTASGLSTDGVKAVYEAFNHRRAAHLSYLIVAENRQNTENERDLQDEFSREVERARELGLGVILIDALPESLDLDHKGLSEWHEKWVTVEEPRRNDPGPRKLDQLVSTQLSKKLDPASIATIFATPKDAELMGAVEQLTQASAALSQAYKAA